MCDDGKHETISYSAEPAASRVIRPQESHQWFALAVKPRFDKAVARALEVKGYETLLPLYKKHRNGARSRISELPLFPGYVCCRFNVQTRLPFLTTPEAMHVLGARNMPLPFAEVYLHSPHTPINHPLLLHHVTCHT